MVLGESKKVRCKALTTKGERCKNYDVTSFCYIHQHLSHSSASNIDNQLVKVTAVGASLITIVEKAQEYLPGLLTIILSTNSTGANHRTLISGPNDELSSEDIFALRKSLNISTDNSYGTVLAKRGIKMLDLSQQAVLPNGIVDDMNQQIDITCQNLQVNNEIRLDDGVPVMLQIKQPT